MDFGTTLKHLAPFIVPILALMIPLLAIGINGWARVRRHREVHETIRQIASAGQPVPPELLAQAAASQGPERRADAASGWTAQANLRGGCINVGVGAGLMIFLYALRPDGWLWAVGAIPLCLGLALLAAWRAERGASSSDGPGPGPTR
ncbi:MAG: hypothetical protein RI988_319 [Pseudomonadota bacterium]